MSRLKVNSGMYLEGDVTKECLESIFESLHQDMWDLQMEASSWNIQDYCLYGYNPWDYAKEIELCLRYSRFTGKVKK